MALETFLGEPRSRDGESNLLWDLKVLADDCFCLAMFLVETGNLGGGGGVSLLSRLASKRSERKACFQRHMLLHDLNQGWSFTSASYKYIPFHLNQNAAFLDF